MTGRNFDYGTQMSNSREGEMAKRTLLTMAKDLYHLYTSLRNEDDLPSWCHYKLARSQNELESVSNYLTSKIAKICIEKDMSYYDLQIEAKNSIQETVISEGFLDFFRSNKPESRRDVRQNMRKIHNPNIESKSGYVNETIKFTIDWYKYYFFEDKVEDISKYQIDYYTDK